MYPGMISWWKSAHSRGGECGPSVGCGPGAGESVHQAAHRLMQEHCCSGGDGDAAGGAFGVRRPLRFLAWKLDLDDAQVADLAAILSDLKTERAQGAVDDRRTVAAFANAVAGEAFDAAQAAEAAAARVKSAERLKDAVTTALSRIHAVLRADQRARFAYLIRTGAISL